MGRMLANYRLPITEINEIQASPSKGNPQNFFPDFKLRPFKAELIQNPGRYLRSEVSSDPRAPKSKIQNRNDPFYLARGFRELV
jgi:hypothetical protein